MCLLVIQQQQCIVGGRLSASLAQLAQLHLTTTLLSYNTCNNSCSMLHKRCAIHRQLSTTTSCCQAATLLYNYSAALPAPSTAQIQKQLCSSADTTVPVGSSIHLPTDVIAGNDSNNNECVVKKFSLRK